MDRKIQMYFLTGFLGSGKTTLLNRMLSMLEDVKTGVIVNEFGQAGVDAALVPETEFDILELNNGQIFCSCLAGDFVQAVVSYADLPIDYLLVETSGLAHPNTLRPVLQAIDDQAGDKIDYRGMVCVIDSVDFPDLVEVLKPVEEQVIRSDVLVINKTDMVDEARLSDIEARVKEMHPGVDIYRTSYCDVPPAVLGLKKQAAETADEAPRRVTAAYSRPETYALRPEGPVPREALTAFLEVVSPETYRIKGFIDVEGSWKHIDVVGTSIDIKKPAGKMQNRGALNIIVKSGASIRDKVEETWQRVVKTAYTIA